MFSQHPLIKNILLMVSGTVGAQLITLATMPIITRLFNPTAIGELGAFSSLITVLVPLAAFTLPAAIVLPRSDITAYRLSIICLWSSLWLSLLLLAILAVAISPIAAALNLESIQNYLWLLPLSIIFSAAHQILQQWYIRKGLFKSSAKVTLLQSLVLNSSKITAGFIAPVGAALVSIQTFGHALHAALLYWLNPSRKGANSHPASTKAKRIKKRLLLNRFRQFPLYQMPQQALNAVSVSLPVLLLSALFSPAVAGLYTLSKTVMGLPSALLGRAVGDVLYPQFAKLQQANKPLTGLISKGILALAGIGILPYLAVVIWGPGLFSLVFGEQWLEAGSIAQWVAVWLFFVFLNQPALKAIMVLNAQHIALTINLATFSLRIAVLTIGSVYFDSVNYAVAGYAIVGVAHNLLIITLAYYVALQHRRNIL